MPFQKPKRTEFTLKKKKETIDAVKKNEPNQSKLTRVTSRKWGINVKRTTVKGILSKTRGMKFYLNKVVLFNLTCVI